MFPPANPGRSSRPKRPSSRETGEPCSALQIPTSSTSSTTRSCLLPSKMEPYRVEPCAPSWKSRPGSLSPPAPAMANPPFLAFSRCFTSKCTGSYAVMPSTTLLFLYSSPRIKRADHPCPAIHGQAYTAGVLLHATDNGIVQEKIEQGTFKTFAATANLVREGDTLIKYQSGLIVVGEDRVSYLVM